MKQPLGNILGKRWFLILCTGLFTHLSMRAASVVWFDGQHPISYQLPTTVEPVVMTALEMWKNDMLQVTGMTPVAARRASVRVVRQSSLPADGFHITVRHGWQIVIEGSNGRGMAYGLLELSRLAGVSPWVWWGDVVPEKKDRLEISDRFVSQQQPSVAYRGIFINDEDWSLRPWSQNTYEPSAVGQIGPQTYKRIFQLLLRLRANALWPAMHPGTAAFFQTEGAKAMADSCGIIIGTSHCEPLLRNNVGEWDVKVRGDFNYRTNRDEVQQYWTERLQQVKGSRDNMFTIGMRGIHDGSMEGYSTEQEKFDALQQVIDDQQQLLRKHVGDPATLMQVFVPYKEVLQLYEKGLRVPDYVTLMWCDDNYGYLTRLSDAAEQQRQGGAGVYYHLSYWGRPHDYLWLTTTQPGLICHQLHQAYDHNVRKLWIVNVHDPKVAGYDLELFLDMAWNIDAVNGTTLNDHYRAWLGRQFGQQVAGRLFLAMHEFYRLCGIRRPEFMGWTQVELDKQRYPRGLSPVDTLGLSPHEAAERLAAFDRIKATVAACRSAIRPELADAFFAAIEYPVFATAAMNRKLLGDSVQSHAAYEEIQLLTDRYNRMCGGKWKGLMDAAPRRLPVFEDVRGHLKSDTQSSNTDQTFISGQAGEITDSCNAFNWKNSSLLNPSTFYQMLGHSMNALALPKDSVLTDTFIVVSDGDYTVQTTFIPTHPADNGDLRFSVAIDDGAPTVYNLKEPFRSEGWKENVLRGQAIRNTTVHLTAGRHTLTIRALDDNIVFDQWKLLP